MDHPKLKKVLDEIIFVPDTTQMQVKAAFWAKHADNPLAPTHDITLAAALDVTGDTRLSRWWGIPGFSAWFTNKDEFRQKAEYVANLALQTIEEILLDREAQPNARIKAAQIAIETANKMPTKYAKEKFIDAKIQEMSRKELDAFIKEAMKELPAGASVDGDDTSKT